MRLLQLEDLTPNQLHLLHLAVYYARKQVSMISTIIRSRLAGHERRQRAQRQSVSIVRAHMRLTTPPAGHTYTVRWYTYVHVRAGSICRLESRTRRAPARGALRDECPALAQAGPCRDARCTFPLRIGRDGSRCFSGMRYFGSSWRSAVQIAVRRPLALSQRMQDGKRAVSGGLIDE